MPAPVPYLVVSAALINGPLAAYVLLEERGETHPTLACLCSLSSENSPLKTLNPICPEKQERGGRKRKDKIKSAGGGPGRAFCKPTCVLVLYTYMGKYEVVAKLFLPQIPLFSPPPVSLYPPSLSLPSSNFRGGGKGRDRTGLA